MRTGARGRPGPVTSNISGRDETLPPDFERWLLGIARISYGPEPNRNRIPWSNLLQNGTSILAVSGVLIYAILSISYGQFYSAIGVSASDVGLSYLTILAGSVGAALALVLLLAITALIIAVITTVFLFFLYLYRFIFQEEFRHRIISGDAGQVEVAIILSAVLSAVGAFVGEIIANFRRALLIAARRYAVKVTVWSVVIIALMLAFYALPRAATARAEQVQKGIPVSQPRLPILPLTLLAIRADPVLVAATGEPGKTLAVEELAARANLRPPLLYLGQANSIVVLYDSIKDEAIYVPSSSLLLRVVNCRAQPTPANC